MNWNHLVGSLIILVPLLFMRSSDAAEFTFTFTGEVSSPSSFPADIPAGTSVSGYYSFSDSVTDDFPSSTEGWYSSHYTGGAINFSTGHSATFSATGGDYTYVDTAVAFYDLSYPASGITLGGADIQFVSIYLQDDDAVFLSSDALPTTPPDIALAERAEGALNLDGFQNLGFDLHTLYLVPEPSSLLLFVGLIATVLAWYRR